MAILESWMCALQAAADINIPTVRQAPNFQANKSALAESAALKKHQPDKGAYIRHVHGSRHAAERKPEYCLDDEDEDWLKKFNQKAMRVKGAPDDACLGNEQFEGLMDQLEQIHFERVVKWYEEDDGGWLACDYAARQCSQTCCFLCSACCPQCCRQWLLVSTSNE